jgi:hypothetical protein
VHALTVAADDCEEELHAVPAQHIGMSFAMQSASDAPVAHRVAACVQNSVTMVEH